MFYELKSVTPQAITDGWHARVYHGTEITFAVVEAQPNAKLPAHSHHNEQVGMLVRGSLTFTVDGAERVVHAGEGWVIPSHAVHDATAGPDGAIVIETWSPPRSDFVALEQLPLMKSTWPES